MPIFNVARDYKRFIETMIYYQIAGPKPRFSFATTESDHPDSNNKIIDIISYCLMPNHFHFLLQQKRHGGITEFISKLTNSYTKYFNIKNNRSGPLLQGEFKAVHVKTDEQLVHLSRYIHLNPLVGYVIKDLETYHWSSYLEYVGITKVNICSKKIILNQFNSADSYKQFILDQVDYGKQLEFIKHQLLDH